MSTLSSMEQLGRRLRGSAPDGGGPPGHTFLQIGRYTCLQIPGISAKRSGPDAQSVLVIQLDVVIVYEGGLPPPRAGEPHFKEIFAVALDQYARRRAPFPRVIIIVVSALEGLPLGLRVQNISVAVKAQPPEDFSVEHEPALDRTEA